MTRCCNRIALILAMIMTTSSSAMDDTQTTRRANVQAAFDAMEAEQIGNDLVGREGHMGRKIPVMKAISTFQKRVVRTPDDFRSMTVLGQLYIRLGKETGSHSAYVSAEKSLRSALEMSPDHLTAITWLAVALQAQHRFREALPLAEKAWSANPHDTMALATIGDCQFHLGRVTQASDTWQKLVEAEGRVAPVLARLARLAQLAEIQGDPQQAISLIEEARDAVHAAGHADAAVAWYELRLASLHHAIDAAEEARVHYQTALEFDNDLHEARIGLGRLLAEHGDMELATDLLEEAVQASGSASAMIGLGDVLQVQGHADTANAWYDRAEGILLKELATSGTAHQRDVSRFFSDRQRSPLRAVDLAKQDLRCRSDIFAHDTLAWALHRNGQHIEAALVMQRALQHHVQDARLHFHAGMIFGASGQSEKAVRHLTMALQINAHFDLLDAKIARQKLTELEALATAKF